MSKLSLEKKAEIVAHYLNTNDGYIRTGQHFNISESTVKMLVAQFKQNGIEGLCHRNGTYSGNFKLYVLQYQKENNLSDKETAVLFKVPSQGTICAWRKKYSEGGCELLCRDGRGGGQEYGCKEIKEEGGAENRA